VAEGHGQPTSWCYYRLHPKVMTEPTPLFCYGGKIKLMTNIYDSYYVPNEPHICLTLWILTQVP
jgi:hypothetical protein